MCLSHLKLVDFWKFKHFPHVQHTRPVSLLWSASKEDSFFIKTLQTGAISRSNENNWNECNIFHLLHTIVVKPCACASTVFKTRDPFLFRSWLDQQTLVGLFKFSAWFDWFLLSYIVEMSVFGRFESRALNIIRKAGRWRWR